MFIYLHLYIYIYTTGKNGVWSHSVNFEYAGANVHFMLNKDEIFDEYIASLNEGVYSNQQRKEMIGRITKFKQKIDDKKIGAHWWEIMVASSQAMDIEKQAKIRKEQQEMAELENMSQPSSRKRTTRSRSHERESRDVMDPPPKKRQK